MKADIRERIKEIRKDFEMSQEEFGSKLGVTKSSISSMESGRFNITDSTIKLICKEFDVNEEWLRTGAGEKDIKKDTGYLYGKAMAKNDDFQISLLNAVLQMTDEELDFLENIVDKIQKNKASR